MKVLPLFAVVCLVVISGFLHCISKEWKPILFSISVPKDFGPQEKSQKVIVTKKLELVSDGVRLGTRKILNSKRSYRIYCFLKVPDSVYSSLQNKFTVDSKVGYVDELSHFTPLNCPTSLPCGELNSYNGGPVFVWRSKDSFIPPWKFSLISFAVD